jgi:prenyltransferase beta subunit
VAIQLYLGRQVDRRLMDWMLSCEAREGGLAAFPRWRADLLSTATGLFAISQLPGGQGAIAGIRRRCTEFVHSLWHRNGSFRSDSGMSEAYLDCEYLWYGLLALGCLAKHD